MIINNRDARRANPVVSSGQVSSRVQLNAICGLAFPDSAASHEDMIDCEHQAQGSIHALRYACRPEYDSRSRRSHGERGGYDSSRGRSTANDDQRYDCDSITAIRKDLTANKMNGKTLSISR